MRPADVKIACVRATGVRDHPGFVFKGNAGSGFVGDDGDGVRLPGLAAIERAADKMPLRVAPCAQ